MKYFANGSTVYYVVSNRFVEEARINGRQYGRYIISLGNAESRISISDNRLFRTKEEAEKTIRVSDSPRKPRPTQQPGDSGTGHNGRGKELPVNAPGDGWYRWYERGVTFPDYFRDPEVPDRRDP